MFNLKKNEWSIIQDLRSSTETVGSLYPILEDFYGNIIDGEHRLKANNLWPKWRLEHVKTEKDRIIVRFVSNMCRRNVSVKEKRKMLNKLAEILIKEGIKPGEISKKIAKDIGMSYTWVMKYLSEKYKDDLQLKRATSATRWIAGIKSLHKLLAPPKEKFLEIQKYQNTNLVAIFIKKPLYERIEKTCYALNTKPDILIQNIIENNLQKITINHRAC